MRFIDAIAIANMGCQKNEAKHILQSTCVCKGKHPRSIKMDKQRLVYKFFRLDAAQILISPLLLTRNRRFRGMDNMMADTATSNSQHTSTSETQVESSAQDELSPDQTAQGAHDEFPSNVATASPSSDRSLRSWNLSDSSEQPHLQPPEIRTPRRGAQGTIRLPRRVMDRINDEVVAALTPEQDGPDYFSIHRQRLHQPDNHEQEEEEEWEDVQELLGMLGIGDGRLLNYEIRIRLGLSLDC